MVLSLNGGDLDNMATFEHLYNRDHEKRRQYNRGEQRIFLACKKCNNQRNEPNNNEPNTIEKTIKKIVPKQQWGDEKFIERISVVIEDERTMQKEISKIDKNINRLKHERQVVANKLAKKSKYRELLIRLWNEENPSVKQHLLSI
jgi:hypothetical protein